MMLTEIINVPPLPYRWVSSEVGTFEYAERPFGIVLESFNLVLQHRQVSVVNISFGVIVDPTQPITASNIDRKLTGFGKPRTIMSTVAEACVNNPHVKSHDMFIVAASEQVTQRVGLYTLALSDLSTRLPEYKFSYRAHTPTNATLVIQSKVELTQEEIEYVGTEVLGKEN